MYLLASNTKFTDNMIWNIENAEIKSEEYRDVDILYSCDLKSETNIPNVKNFTGLKMIENDITEYFELSS